MSETRYLQILKDAIHFGEPHEDRTGVGTRSLFGEHIEFNCQRSFPLLTTKRVAFMNTFRELKWFLSGSTNVRDLHESARHWWTPWADDFNQLGPTYGKQIRGQTSFNSLNDGPSDQLATVLGQIENNPTSRRILMTTWNAADVPYTRLPPCHGLVTQFYCHSNGGLSLQTYQRSADLFLGFPVNIASYALLLYMVAKVTNRTPNMLKITIGDAHLYLNHFDQAKEQLGRKRRPRPKLHLDMPEGATALERLLNFEEHHLHLEGYDPHPAIKAEVAV